MESVNFDVASPSNFSINCVAKAVNLNVKMSKFIGKHQTIGQFKLEGSKINFLSIFRNA